MPLTSSTSSNLTNINNEVTLGITLAGQLLPLVTGIVKDVKSRQTKNAMEYTIVISTGQENLKEAASNFQASLDEINTELAKQSAPQVEKPVIATVLHG